MSRTSFIHITNMLILFIYCSSNTLSIDKDGYYLPILAPNGVTLPYERYKIANKNNKKKLKTDNIIPKNLWIAVVNKTEVLEWEHIQKEIKLNPTWNVYICDNNDKDKFMREYFNGTSYGLMKILTHPLEELQEQISGVMLYYIQ